MKKFLVLALILPLFVVSCRRIEKKQSDQSDKHIEAKDSCQGTDQLVMATLWYQHSAERRALCYQAFNWARSQIDQELAKHRDSKPYCVVLDIDETVLDNSPFEGKCISTGKPYTKESWKQWSDQAQAQAIPGAVEFCDYADKKGVEVFYVTNRRENEKDATLKNISDLGFPNADEAHLYLRTNESSKKARRATIQERYNIVVLLGDNLNDFSELFEDRSGDYGFGIVDSLKAEFGQRFILLPNPMYGSWERLMLKVDSEKDLTSSQIRKKQIVAY